MSRPKSSLPEYLKEIKVNDKTFWIRKCPKCSNNINHKNYVSAKNCHKQKRLCYACANWITGLSKETDERVKKMGRGVSKSMKEIRKIIPPWNKGLTKENNEILKYMGEKHIGYKHTEETKKLIGEHSKLLWDRGYWGGRHTNEWMVYNSKVRMFTRKNVKQLSDIDFNKRGKMGVSGSYQIDHIIPIKYGFDNNINEELISDVSNLRFIPWEENIKKGKKYDGKNKI